MEDIAYQVYLDMVKGNLIASNLRVLTEREEEIVIAHLVATTLTFCNDPRKLENGADLYTRRLLGTYGICQLLSIEAARKVCEIHPDIPTPTQEQIDKVTETALAERTFLLSQYGRTLER